MLETFELFSFSLFSTLPGIEIECEKGEQKKVLHSSSLRHAIEGNENGKVDENLRHLRLS